MDIIYTYRKTSSPELDWSIKSLKNISHDKVYVLGDLPFNQVDATHVAVPDTEWSTLSTQASVFHRLYHACDLVDGNNFIFMMDDVFMLEPWQPINYVRKTSLKDHIDYAANGKYKQSLKVSYDWLIEQGYKNPKDYELHTPFIMNKHKTKELFDRLLPLVKEYGTVSPRSIYGNVYNIKATVMPIDTKGCKQYKGRTILSTNEDTFAGEIGDYIRSII
jgi:hypothetical protein